MKPNFSSQKERENYRLTTKTQSSQSIASGQNDTETLNTKLTKKSPQRKPKTAFTLPSSSNVAALLIKNWITMKRNILLLLFVFFLPGIVLLINSLAIGLSPTHLPLALVNLENDCRYETITITITITITLTITITKH